MSPRMVVIPFSRSQFWRIFQLPPLMKCSGFQAIYIYKKWVQSVCLFTLISDTRCRSFMKFWLSRPSLAQLTVKKKRKSPIFKKNSISKGGYTTNLFSSRFTQKKKWFTKHNFLHIENKTKREILTIHFLDLKNVCNDKSNTYVYKFCLWMS